MIVSNEPGYYKTGAFGIRIENLQYVTPLQNIEHGEKPMLGFKTLTMVPYEKKLIECDLLNQQERNYIGNYYQNILSIYKDKLNKNEYNYLTNICKIF
jgi:Xaa-Pro aminopeptidase